MQVRRERAARWRVRRAADGVRIHTHAHRTKRTMKDTKTVTRTSIAAVLRFYACLRLVHVRAQKRSFNASRQMPSPLRNLSASRWVCDGGQPSRNHLLIVNDRSALVASAGLVCRPPRCGGREGGCFAERTKLQPCASGKRRHNSSSDEDTSRRKGRYVSGANASGSVRRPGI